MLDQFQGTAVDVSYVKLTKQAPDLGKKLLGILQQFWRRDTSG